MRIPIRSYVFMRNEASDDGSIRSSRSQDEPFFCPVEQHPPRPPLLASGEQGVKWEKDTRTNERTNRPKVYAPVLAPIVKSVMAISLSMLPTSPTMRRCAFALAFSSVMRSARDIVVQGRET